jgi:hypothetical protein
MPLMWQNYAFNVAKTMPLTFQTPWNSKSKKSPKKVLKRFKKDIKKFGAIYPPSQIQKQKNVFSICLVLKTLICL